MRVRILRIAEGKRKTKAKVFRAEGKEILMLTCIEIEK